MSEVLKNELINFIKDGRWPVYINTVKADLDDANLLCDHICKGYKMRLVGKVVENKTTLYVETNY